MNESTTAEIRESLLRQLEDPAITRIDIEKINRKLEVLKQHE